MSQARAASLPFLFLLAAAVPACSGGDGGGGGKDFGEESIPMTEDCGGVAGMNGNAILAANTVTHVESELAYTTATGGSADETGVAVDLSWPTASEAICYPAYEEDGLVIAQPRLAVEGVTFAIVTSDGGFAESLDAKGWIFSNGGFANPPMVVAVTDYGDLEGDWEPYPDYTPIGTTMVFVTTPVAGNPELTYGNVGRGPEKKSELAGGVFRSRFQMASW